MYCIKSRLFILHGFNLADIINHEVIIMRYTYSAVFIKENNGYSVIFPDFLGGTQGSSLDEAIYMAMEFLTVSMKWAEKDNEIIPKPTPIELINPNQYVEDLDTDDYSEVFILPITADIDEYFDLVNNQARQIISIRNDLFQEAIEHELDLSQILQEALINKLQSMQ